MPEFEEEGYSMEPGEKTEKKKYPETCDCGWPNTENASSCGNCEKEFEPITPEESETLVEEEY